MNFDIFGSGLFDAAELTPAGVPINDAKGPMITLSGATVVKCSYPEGKPSSSDNDARITVTVPIGTAAGNYNVTVQRNGLTAPGPGEPTVSIVI